MFLLIHPDCGSDTLRRNLEIDSVFFAAVNKSFFLRRLVANHSGDASVSVLEHQNLNSRRGIETADFHHLCSRTNHRTCVKNIVPMGIACQSLVVRRVDCHSSIAGLAGTVVRTVRRILVVEHQIPKRHSHSSAFERAEEYGRKIVRQAGAEIVVPLANRSLCEIDVLLRICRHDVVELRNIATVTVPSGTCGPFACLRIGIDVQRIVALVILDVVVVVVVEKENLHFLQARILECRPENLDKFLLVLPRHIHRH